MNHSSLIIDNLILQQVGETLTVGLTDDNRVELAAFEGNGYSKLIRPSSARKHWLTFKITRK